MDDKNVVEQMIGYLSTPIAKHKGVSISQEECEIWVDEFNKFLAIQRAQTGSSYTFYEWMLDNASKAQMGGRNIECDTLLKVIGEYRKTILNLNL